jgi:hypothetical protein
MAVPAPAKTLRNLPGTWGAQVGSEGTYRKEQGVAFYYFSKKVRGQKRTENYPEGALKHDVTWPVVGSGSGD